MILMKNIIIISIFIAFGIIVTFLGIIFTSQFSQYTPIITIWSVLTAYIILFFRDFQTEKQSKRKNLIVINKIKDLALFIFENPNSIISKQEESEKRISHLQTHHQSVLENWNCNFTRYNELIITTPKSTYYSTPVDLKRRTDNQIKDISKDLEEIEDLFDYLDNFSEF